MITRQWRVIETLLLFLLLFGVAKTALAGDPGPYRLVFMDISETRYQDGQKLLIELRNAGSFAPPEWEGCFMCSSDHNEVSHLFVYTVPVGLSVENLRKVVAGDAAAKLETQNILNQFADANGVTVSGLLIYQHSKGKVTIYSLGSVPGSKLHSVSKPVKFRLLHSSLDNLLEQVSSKIDRPL